VRHDETLALLGTFVGKRPRASTAGGGGVSFWWPLTTQLYCWSPAAMFIGPEYTTEEHGFSYNEECNPQTDALLYNTCVEAQIGTLGH
jgi:hypothetical protein